MDAIEIENWLKIATDMEAAGTTESWFYRRARAIADGNPDPMPNVSQLMPEQTIATNNEDTNSEQEAASWDALKSLLRSKIKRDVSRKIH